MIDWLVNCYDRRIVDPGVLGGYLQLDKDREMLLLKIFALKKGKENARQQFTKYLNFINTALLP